MFSIFFDFFHLSKMENEEKIFMKKFGERVREIRIDKKFSQEMLANDANIPTNQIGRIERAEISPSLNTINKIAKALEISLADFFTF